MRVTVTIDAIRTTHSLKLPLRRNRTAKSRSARGGSSIKLRSSKWGTEPGGHREHRERDQICAKLWPFEPPKSATVFRVIFVVGSVARARFRPLGRRLRVGRWQT